MHDFFDFGNEHLKTEKIYRDVNSSRFPLGGGKTFESVMCVIFINNWGGGSGFIFAFTVYF